MWLRLGSHFKIMYIYSILLLKAKYICYEHSRCHVSWYGLEKRGLTSTQALQSQSTLEYSRERTLICWYQVANRRRAFLRDKMLLLNRVHFGSIPAARIHHVPGGACMPYPRGPRPTAFEIDPSLSHPENHLHNRDGRSIRPASPAFLSEGQTGEYLLKPSGTS